MFKDASWWVCSFFIGVFFYMLGTVSNLSALTVISNIATGIAGLATAFAAFYAYKSFNSWEERLKTQHLFEQESLALKELSKTYEVLMNDFFEVITSYAVAKQEGMYWYEAENNDGEKDNKRIQQCKEDTRAANKMYSSDRSVFHKTLADYTSKFNYFLSFQPSNPLDKYTPNEILLYLNKFLTNHHVITINDHNDIDTFRRNGSKIITQLFLGTYGVDKKLKPQHLSD